MLTLFCLRFGKFLVDILRVKTLVRLPFSLHHLLDDGIPAWLVGKLPVVLYFQSVTLSAVPPALTHASNERTASCSSS